MTSYINKTNSVCGWDIGIKNCSYCIIDNLDNNNNLDNNINLDNENNNNPNNINSTYITINNNKYSIREWDVINVLPEVEKMQINKGIISLDARPQLKCTKITKQIIMNDNNAINETCYCNKNATFVSQDIPTNNTLNDNLNAYNYVSYCNKHFKEVGPENSNQYIFLNDKKLKCCYVDSKSDKCGSARISWVHPQHFFLTYCDKHSKLINADLDNLECIKIVKNKNAAQLDLTMLGCALFQRFDTLPNLCDIGTILLENQPVLKNPTMKSIQMFLFSYFIMRGVQIDTSPCNTIKCYSANQKLDLHKILDEDAITTFAETIAKLSNVYSRNKKLAILLVEYILTNCGTNCESLLRFFREHKKRDDLADSFLMTLHFMEVDNLKKVKPVEVIKTLLKKKSLKPKKESKKESKKSKNNLDDEEDA